MSFSRELFERVASQRQIDKTMLVQLRNYIDQLVQNELPVIFSPNHWALMMGYEYTIVSKILEERESFYHSFSIKKRSGGLRHIRAPQNELKSIQIWIKENILDRLSFPEYVTAYQKNKSIVNNARFHAGKELILKFDLQNYFDTITEPQVYGLFQILGYHKSVAVDLAKACCSSNTKKINSRLAVIGTLPQGAPTSPGLSNLAAFRLDLRLNSYATKHNFTYSRYADDLTFSGESKNKLKQTVIRKIVSSEKFVLNERKGSYRFRSTRQIVTGLNVNERVSIPKVFRKQIAAHIHNCLRFGPSAHLRKIDMEERHNFRDWLLGSILYIYSVHPKEGQKMRERFNRISWLY